MGVSISGGSTTSSTELSSGGAVSVACVLGAETGSALAEAGTALAETTAALAEAAGAAAVTASSGASKATSTAEAGAETSTLVSSRWEVFVVQAVC